MVATPTIRDYYDGFLEHLKHDHERENPRHAKIKKDLKKIIRPGHVVMDIGCGTGITTKYMAELGAKVMGWDISPGLIEFAKEHSAHSNATYRVLDITDFKMEDVTIWDEGYSQDVICLVDVMEHIPRERIPQLLEGVRRFSKKTTIIYLNIPDARFQAYMIEHYPDKLQIVDEAYSMREILQWFDSIRYAPVKIEVYGLDVPVQYTSYVFIRDNELADNYAWHLSGKR